MQRTPPEKDEQSEDSQISYPTQPRRTLRRSRRRQTSYNSDEHPEIPKVRRASLYLKHEQISPASTVKQEPAFPPAVTRQTRVLPSPSSERARVAPSPTSKRVRVAPSSPSKRMRTSPSSTSRMTHRARVEEEQEPDEHAQTGKIMVARRRRPRVYEPPQVGSHGRRKRRRPLAYILLQRLSQYRTPTMTGGMILVILILVPLLTNAIAKGAPHSASALSTPVSQVRNKPPFVQIPSDPHELVIVPANNDHPAPPVYATSAYLLDADTGVTLYAHNPFMHLPMLSTTKLMTALLAVEQGNPDQKITINDAIAHDISQLSGDSSLMGIKKGETYTLRDLLYGLLLVSGNDAAVAIADGISGNLKDFVARMNQRAVQLGLHDTHYMNPHGLLTTGHYSSAHDLALLGRYSLSNPLIHQISATQQYHITQSHDHPDRFLINGNQFLWWYPGVDGGKPGWDSGTNFIQVISCIRNNHHLIGVTMHTKDWWTDMRDLMNWGFDIYNWISPYDVDFQHPIPYDIDWNYFSRDKKENTIPTENKGRYYIYTGYSISDPILSFFDKGGGLKKFGYPIGMPDLLTNGSISQKFEHATLQCDTTTKQCKTL